MLHSASTRFIRIVFFLAATCLPAQGLETVPLDLVVNGRPAGSITCRIGSLSISAERTRLIEALRPFLDAQVVASLEAITADYVDVAQMRNYGVLSRYDSSTLQLSLTVMPQMQGLQVVRVGALPSQTGLVTEEPASFSAYLNMRAVVNMLSAADATSLPSQLVLQPVVNYKGWVVDISETSSTSQEVSLDYARVSHDFIEGNQRLTIGSLFLPVTGFMSSQSLYGVEFFEDPRMTENLHDLNLLPQQFLLSQASSVSVLLNNNVLGAYHLEPGKYLIPNVVYGNGLNTLVVRTDGSVVLQATIPYDSRLLAERAMSYSVSLGAPQWQLTSPLVSGFFLYGLTPYLTTGFFTQDGIGDQMAGVEGTYATPLGNFHTQIGVSTGAAVDFAAELDYQLAFGYGAYNPVINLSAQYTGQSFAVAGLGQSLDSWLFSVSYTQPLPYELSLGLGLGYQIGWEPNPDQVNANVTIARPVGKDTNANLIVSVTHQTGYPVQVQVTFMLSAFLNGGKESGFASFSSQMSSATFRYQPAMLLPYGTFSVSQSGQVTSGSASVQYTTPFIDSSFSDSVSSSFNNLSLSSGIALVTAGGAFGITRPISDSFAIILPRDNMRGQTVFANATQDGYDGVATDTINIGLSNLSAYTRSAVTLSSPTAPVDSSMGSIIRVLSPTYKSGTVVAVGTKATIFIAGTLVSAGQPLSYRAGQLTLLSHSEAFFTDENGDFQVYNLTPGTWTLTINGTEIKQDITIPETASKQYAVGTIEVGK